MQEFSSQISNFVRMVLVSSRNEELIFSYLTYMYVGTISHQDLNWQETQRKYTIIESS